MINDETINISERAVPLLESFYSGTQCGSRFQALQNSFSGRSAFAPGRVHLDPRDVGAACSAVSATGHEIDVADLVHTAQVRVVDLKLDDDFFRMQLEPTLIVGRHHGPDEIPCERV